MAFAGTYSAYPFEGAADFRNRLRRLDRLSRLLDIALVIPGTRVRFGVDAVLGLVPVVGNWAGVALSSIIIVEAVRIGVPRPLIARMIANIAVEGLAGTVPIAGDVFDVFWRANRRNMALLMDHLRDAGRI